MPWFDLVKLRILFFGKSEDLGWCAAGLICQLSACIILGGKKEKESVRVFVAKSDPLASGWKCCPWSQWPFLHSAGVVCCLPYPILPGLDRSLQWFWIPFYSLSKFQLLFFFLSSFLFLLPACLVSISLCCASALAGNVQSSLFLDTGRKGKYGSVLAVQAAGRHCRSFIYALLSHSEAEVVVSFGISEVLGRAWLSPARVNSCSRRPHKFLIPEYSHILATSTGACFCSCWRPGYHSMTVCRIQQGFLEGLKLKTHLLPHGSPWAAGESRPWHLGQFLPILLHWPWCLQGCSSPVLTPLSSCCFAVFCALLSSAIPEVMPQSLVGSGSMSELMASAPLDTGEVPGSSSQKPLLMPCCRNLASQTHTKAS